VLWLPGAIQANLADLELKAGGIFALQASSRSRHGEERPQHDQSVGSPKGSAPFLLAVSRSRGAGGGGARCRASSNYNEFLLGLGGKGS